MSWLPRHHSYAMQSVGALVVWAVLLLVVFATHQPRRHIILAVGAGWFLGWLFATLARFVAQKYSQSERSEPGPS